MKVVAFICNLSKGGAQGVFVNVVNYIYNQGIEVEVVVQTMDDPVYGDKLDRDISITNLCVPSAKKMLLPLKKYLEQNDFTHALAFGAEIAINLYFLRKILHRKFKIIGRSLNTLTQEFSYADGFFRKQITSQLIKKYFHRIDFAIAQSTNMKNDMVENWGFDARNVVVINNPLRPEFEYEAVNCGSSIKENYIMYAGRLEKQKGIEMLLKAFSMIENQSIDLKIIGSGSLKESLMRQCKELKIENRVVFIDHTTDIMNYYKRARVVVLTSYYEGFPNVLVEAIACGTPVVSYDLPSGPKEIVVEGVNGHLVPYLNVNEFSKTMNIALKRSWDSAEVKETSTRYFSKNIMPKYIRVLEDA